MLNVEKEKIPIELKYLYNFEFTYNDGYFRASCEWDLLNSQCHYIKKGCTGCEIKSFRKDVLYIFPDLKRFEKFIHGRLEPVVKFKKGDKVKHKTNPLLQDKVFIVKRSTDFLTVVIDPEKPTYNCMREKTFQSHIILTKNLEAIQ